MGRDDSPLKGRMLFVIGAPRSGTYWLQRILATHPTISTVPSETHLFSTGLAPLFHGFQSSLEGSPRVGLVYVERDAVLEATRDLCDVILGRFLKPDASYLIERTPQHAFHVALIREVYPDARFIHIIRDGRDVARSIAAQHWGPDDIGEAAAIWRDAISAARATSLGAERYHEVRYESLYADPAGLIFKVFSWLGLENDEPIAEAAIAEASTPGNMGRISPAPVAPAKWESNLSCEELRTVEHVAGSLLRDLGYAEAAGCDKSREQSRSKVARRVSEGLQRSRGVHARRRRRKGPTVGRQQELMELVITSFQTGNSTRLFDEMSPTALVRVLHDQSTSEARGATGRELLSRTVVAHPANGAPQVRGDAFPSVPYWGSVLTHEPEKGTLVHTVTFIRVQHDRITELIVYRFEGVDRNARDKAA